MTQEENQLLFIDLCERLPHRVICHASKINLDGELFFINKLYNIVALYNDKAVGKFDTCSITDVKPYLRLMSSMTEEEMENLEKCLGKKYDFRFTETESFIYIDWLNAHHFDYRGLIEKSLAIVATEEMYK